MVECPICGSSACEKFSNTSVKIPVIECERCGKYWLSNDALMMYSLSKKENSECIPRISYWIRQHQGETLFEIDRSAIKNAIGSIELPKAKEQANNFMLILGKGAEYPESVVSINALSLCSMIGAKDIYGLKYIAKYLENKKYIIGSINDIDNSSISLTFEGWDYYDQISKTTPDSKIAFMAMEYNDPELDIMFKEILKPTVALTGFKLRRLDEKLEAGIIDNRLRVEIRNARFLIVDLTSDNSGAYFEAGFAEGLGKPVIYICESEKFKEKKTHFDTNHNLTLTWNKNDLEPFREELKATIRNTIPIEAKMLDE
ncbi:MAG: hypothetical protein ABR980_11690 [Ignavibacteriaceae bacterium]|jgi:hypothetical protein